jgi:hypothetical protein
VAGMVLAHWRVVYTGISAERTADQSGSHGRVPLHSPSRNPIEVGGDEI